MNGIPSQLPLPSVKPSAQAGKSEEMPTISQDDQRRLNEATADFEAMFIQQLFKSMRRTIPEGANGSLFAKGQGEKIFGEMLDGEYARNFSRGRSGLGLKEAIFKQTVSNQLARGVVPQNAINRLRENENSLNALAQSPIGMAGGVRGGVENQAQSQQQPPTASKPQQAGIAAGAIDKDL